MPMRHTLPRFALISLIYSSAFAAFVVAAADQTPASASSPISSEDVAFFENAAQTGLTEVAAARIATERSWSNDVKAFAKTMNTDHTANNKDLAVLAERKGVTLPAALDDLHRKTLSDLQAADAKQFDVAYAADMAQGHQDAIALFSIAASQSKDADVRAFAAKNPADT